MNAALLKESIEIYEIPIEQTDYGNIKDGTPVFKYKTRAYAQFDSQARVVSEGEVFYPQDRTFIVRYYVPVEERDRIRWNNKWWRIVSINPNKYYNDKEIRVVEQND